MMVNNFEMLRDWVYNGPPIFFALIAGSLSDKLGRKPLLVLPAIGFFLRSCSSLFIYSFLKHLPLEIFILEEIDCFFGGLAVFSIGMYGYGSTITSPSERASTLVRYDGIKALAQIMGTALSPLIFAYLGFYGSYMFRFTFTLGALIYLIVLIKEPMQMAKTSDPQDGQNKTNDNPTKNCTIISKMLYMFKEHILKSAWETLRTLFRQRRDNLRMLIFVQILIGACYRFSSANYTLTYLYMKRVFSADQSHYALLKTVIKCLQCLCLLTVTPYILRKGMHEAVFCGIVAAISSLALLLSACADNVWQFLFARWGLLLRPSKHGPAKALLTESCEAHEVTKILAVNSLVAYAVPYVALPTMRMLYNIYLDTSTPYAYILLAASVLAFSSILNFCLYTQKDKFVKDEEIENEDVFVTKT